MIVLLYHEPNETIRGASASKYLLAECSIQGGAMILITGAAGNVGAELIKKLSERGTPARAFVRNRAQARAIALPGIEIVEGDFTKPETLTRALVGVDRLFLLIPSSSQVEKQHAASLMRQNAAACATS